jgi:hypothetical protein
MTFMLMDFSTSSLTALMALRALITRMHCMPSSRV